VTLFEHQRDGAAWLADRPRAYLGDEPGLGKTRTVLRALGDLGCSNTLIVTPAIVRTHWRRESELMAVRPLVMSYDEVVRGGAKLMRELLVEEAIDGLVLDEAHYCKHATSQRAQILLGKDGYARRLERVWLASGTPMPRNPRELFTQLCYLRPDVLVKHGVARLDAWTERFCVVKPTFARGKKVEKVIGVKNADQLQEILAEVMLRRTLDDVGLDVPEIFWQTLRLDGQGDASELSGVSRETLAAINAGDLESIADDPHVARMRRRLGELKVTPVAQMLSSQLADSDEKIVVFAYHRSVLHALRELLGPFGVAYVDGEVTGRARDEAIDRFQTDPRCRVFLGQNIACQTGITLHAAHRVVLVEPEWMGDVNFQLAKRLARIGSTASRCVAQMIALAGTLDEAIIGQCEREARMVTAAGL
jgi:SWI/SNF-related matrix-associated actin-dependent regulator 1 of chromatin subfamily A